MHTFRAAGAILEDFQSSKISNLFDSVDHVSTLKTGDLSSLLVCSGAKICLTVVEITNFLVGKEKSL